MASIVADLHEDQDARAGVPARNGASRTSCRTGNATGWPAATAWVENRDDKTIFGALDDHRLRFTAAEFDRYLAVIHAG